MNVTGPAARAGHAGDLINLINCVWMSQAVCVAAELNIADLLSDGPMPADALARATDTHAPSLRRLMRALVALGLCRECEGDGFGLTATGALLQSNAPDSLRPWALYSHRFLWPLWSRLLDSVRSGQHARKLIGGTEDFGHLEGDGAAAEAFNDAMMALTRLLAGEVARRYDFAGVQRIVDVGGGYGALLGAVLSAWPQAQGVLYDLPHAREGAHAHFAAVNVAERCEFVAGSFFDSIPADADVYLLKSIIHDWDDRRSAAILQNCRRAIARDGRLLLIERIMPARLEPCALHRILARADLTMLIGIGGRERTEAGFRALLDAAGFEMTRTVPLAFAFNIIEASPRPE